MAGVQRIISNSTNLLATATITPASVRPSNAIFLDSVTRTGSGRLSVSGSFTGGADTTLSVEVVDTLGALEVSAPQFSGVGNGTLTLGALEGDAVAQTITLTLIDLGTTTTAASVEFAGVTLKAKTPGTGGNTITVSASRSSLVLTNTYTLLEDLPKASTKLEGAQWDFGAQPLLSDGKLHPSTPRLAIGVDFPVYRQYKVFEGGAWVYYLHPATPFDLARLTPVKVVTGTYTVTIAQGVTTETYTGITTLFDFLQAVRARSALVEVVGVIGDDRTPGGMAAIDLPLITSSYTQPPLMEGSKYLTHLPISSVSPAAPTELIEIVCTDNSVVGAEKWGVTGSASGELLDATTGMLYSDPASPLGFTIPRKLPPGDPAKSAIYISEIRWATREDAALGVPDICLYKPYPGGKLKESKTLTLVYTKRPPDECDCKNATVEGGPDPKCLGIDIKDIPEDPDMDANLQSMLTTLFTWRANCKAANKAIEASTGEIKVALHDMRLVDGITATFYECAKKIYASADARLDWDNAYDAMVDEVAQFSAINGNGGKTVFNPFNNSYPEGTEVVPPAAHYNGHYYKVEWWEQLGDPPAYTTVKTAEIQYRPEAWPTDGGSFLVEAVYKNRFHTDYTSDPDSKVADPDYYDLQASLRDMGPIGVADITREWESPGYSGRVAELVKVWEARMDQTLVVGGLFPNSDAGGSGTSCWRDPKHAYYWKVQGTKYLPVFTNVYYHSTALIPNKDGDMVPTDTFEFGFALRIDCTSRLIEGDTVIVVIDDIEQRRTYEIDDTFRVPVIAATPLTLSGGVSGNDTVKWKVVSSTDGELADYAIVGGAPTEYTLTDVNFTVRSGAIPYELADRWTLAIEGGHLKYRWGAGAWSAPAAISGEVGVGNGLSLVATRGAAPSFATGDSYSFRIEQPYGVASLLSPVPLQGHQWVGDDQTIAIDLGASQPVYGVAMALTTLPLTATLTLRGGTSPGVWAWTQPLAVADPLYQLFPNGNTARYLELIVSAAPGARIGWLWLGLAFTPSISASRCQYRRSYALARGSGINPGAIYLGQGGSGEIAWEGGAARGGALREADLNALISIIDHSKRHGDEPFALIPNAQDPDAWLVSLAEDDVTIEELSERQASAALMRLYSVTLPLRGVRA